MNQLEIKKHKSTRELIIDGMENRIKQISLENNKPEQIDINGKMLVAKNSRQKAKLVVSLSIFKICLKLGIPAPDTISVGQMANFLINNYGNLSVIDFEHAYDLALIGTLDVDLAIYGKAMNLPYMCNVLNNYIENIYKPELNKIIELKRQKEMEIRSQSKNEEREQIIDKMIYDLLKAKTDDSVKLHKGHYILVNKLVDLDIRKGAYIEKAKNIVLSRLQTDKENAGSKEESSLAQNKIANILDQPDLEQEVKSLIIKDWARNNEMYFEQIKKEL